MADTMETVTEAPRENLINTAVNFLQNEKVKGSPLAQKKAFLAKKGLSSEEIDLAVQRAGVTETAVVPATAVQPPVVTQQHHVSVWRKARDMVASGIVIGGLGYLVYSIYKKYIVPYLYGASQEQQQLAAMQKGIKELQDCVQQMIGGLQQSLAAVKEGMEKQDQVLREITFQGQNSGALVKMQNTHSTSEIKQEIASLKALLLNRKQFPAAPPSTPVLPAWQRSSLPPADTAQDASPADLSTQTSSPTHRSDSTGPAGASESSISLAQACQADSGAQQPGVSLVAGSADSQSVQYNVNQLEDLVNASAAEGKMGENPGDSDLTDQAHENVQEQVTADVQEQPEDQH